MKIVPHTITIRELVAGYRNDEEEGVVAYGGRLDVRPKYRREMKGLDWGGMFRLYGRNKYDPAMMERDIQRLMADDDVTRKGGIYEYLLSGGEQESALSIRKFTESQKRAAYERQGGKCADCGRHFEFEDMHGDHKTPWSKGGHTLPDNLQMLCRTCNLKKSER